MRLKGSKNARATNNDFKEVFNPKPPIRREPTAIVLTTNQIRTHVANELRTAIGVTKKSVNRPTTISKNPTGFFMLIVYSRLLILVFLSRFWFGLERNSIQPTNFDFAEKL